MRVIFVLILERLVCSGIFVFKTKTIYIICYLWLRTYLNILDSWNIKKNTIRGKKDRKGESEEDVKMGKRAARRRSEHLQLTWEGKNRRIRKCQKESERQKWYHMYITATRGRQDNFRLQAGFTSVNGVILYDQVMIGLVKRGYLWWFFLCS